MFIEFGSSPEITVGGSIEMWVKTGKPDNYPIVTLEISYSIVSQKLNLDGALSGQNAGGCWHDAFGVMGLAICDVKIGLSLTYIAPWLARFSFQGAIKIGDPAAPKHKFAIAIMADLQKPTNNAFMGLYE